MIEQTRIGPIGRLGDGIAETPAGRAHVAFHASRRTVEVERDGDRGTLRQGPGAECASARRRFARISAFAAAARSSIGQARPYLSWKRDLVADALARAGVEAPVNDTIDAHGAGRSRAVFHAGRGKNPAAARLCAAALARNRRAGRMSGAGEAAGRSAADCAELAKLLAATGKAVDIQFTLAREGIDIDMRGSGKLPSGIEAKLVSFAAAKRIARLTLHGDTVAQLAPPTIRIGKAVVALPPGPFLQATEAGENCWRNKVLDAAQGAKVGGRPVLRRRDLRLAARGANESRRVRFQ